MESKKADVALQLRSLVKSSGELELSLVSVPVPEPGPDEVLIRVDAAPINPSDLGLLFGAADMSTARQSGTAERPVVTASVPEGLMKAMAGRVDESMPVGNEGAGVVVAAGTSAAAQALLGKTVATLGGAMYSQYRCVKVAQCLVLPPGTSAAEGASCFVNPLTALCMVETMRREGHTALVHTAAASNLGQMLNRLCIRDQVGLVNVVRNRSSRSRSCGRRARNTCATRAPRPSCETSPRRSSRPGRRWPSTRSAAARSPGRSWAAWRAALHALGQGVSALRVDDPQAGLRLRCARHRPDRAEAQLSAWPGASAAGC